ncbi:prepilin peptidase CpaA [Vibrio crassostreae]|uniref:Prepilin type IV endopeptidase peptidase domain-containing protein n=1 Tax=Vibrio crassostreae TaxID=246167 RepID=A0A822MVJ6_9VIBR|nr:prepilin peptidase [Vibrio crassostreae]MDH5952496.1 prepilin peptidase [Vibrio crassostreae]TCN09307.1 prepilin peptidase CpaA [Vibrio crassostreae]TCU10353.1 prepilin peptidase CpaA [Vibrio crassostreae]CAK1969821.1 prepilin peptidase CpaA [Vibrio crassostreae]CAK2001987.1 prepilin peptidase CpaA [Vibrio crassostreae]
MYLLILAIVGVYVSVTDFLYRKIQNHALLILLFLQCFLSPLDIQIMSSLLVLGGGLIVYALIWIGAGDIKYAAVLSLTIPLNDLHWAFVMTAFAGGFLAVIYLVNNKLISKKLTRKTSSDQQGIPYGIAISVGFYLVILTQNTPHI